MHKINISELKPGMVIIDPKLSWVISPYLYTVPGPVDSEEAIAKIASEGFLEAYIQDERDIDPLPQPATPELRPDSTLPKRVSELPAVKRGGFAPPPPQVELAEELPKAKALYEESLRFVGDTLNTYREGSELPLTEAEPLMDAMLESVTRNDNAFLVLSKLRHRDEYTYTHSINVAFLSMAFARQLGLGDEAAHRLGMAGLFHDLGKNLVPDKVLNSPRKLRPDEFDIMKQHPRLGLDQLLTVKDIHAEVLEGAFEHHEKFNGQGYPRGLKGEEISLTGRVLSIVDVFDALTSKRVYKDAMPMHKALGLIFTQAGTDFQAELAHIFIKGQGIYPTGSVVLLSNGVKAVVMENSFTTPLMPKIMLVRDASGQRTPPQIIDLKRHKHLTITKLISPEDAMIDPAEVLGLGG